MDVGEGRDFHPLPPVCFEENKEIYYRKYLRRSSGPE